MLNNALALFLQPCVKRRIEPVQVFEEARLKQPKAGGLIEGRTGDRPNIDWKALLKVQRQMIAAGSQDGAGTRTKFTLQLVQ